MRKQPQQITKVTPMRNMLAGVLVALFPYPVIVVKTEPTSGDTLTIGSMTATFRRKRLTKGNR